MLSKIDKICEKALNGKGISRDEAETILRIDNIYLSYLLAWTDRIRQTFNGNSIELCSVINARSGGCSEDCSFCSQSAYSTTDIATYPLLSADVILEGARSARSNGAARFCLATSGNGITNDKELKRLCEVTERIRSEAGIEVCATLGAMTVEQISALKDAGLSRFHHNLEAAESYFPSVCTTHTYRDRIEQVAAAKEAGLSTCSGGLFGMGESLEQRAELAFALMELNVDSVPVNFLMPQAGTALGNVTPIRPAEAIKVIAMLRILMPDKEIRICGGRMTALKDLHPLIFSGGANGMMIGNYLTRSGREPHLDLQMLEDLGLDLASL
ncbi:MAG: biotin synthase BioB [Nitrospirae bacterium]|nr:biotin synthase BioB [Nitrospirota bacterium]